MRVLVTGGAGFIGSHLCEALHRRGDEVVVLDNFDAFDGGPERQRRSVQRLNARVIEGDLRDEVAVDEAIDGVDVVVHLAARAGVRPSLSEPRVYASINVEGTAVLLDRLHRSGKARMVFASSSSVYGVRSGAAFKETDDADSPASPYAATKRAGELLCHAAHAAWGLQTTCLRLFTVYGPGQRASMAVSRFVQRTLAGKPIEVYGDGSSLRDYTYVSDAVDAIVRAADRPLGFDVINVGSGSPVRLGDLVAAVGRAVGRMPVVAHLPNQAGDVPMTFASIERARQRLDWAPAVGLDEGLRRVVDEPGR